MTARFAVTLLSFLALYAASAYANVPVIVYYTDDSCSSIGTSKVFVNNEPQQLVAGNGQTCLESLPCLLAPDGTDCAAIRASDSAVTVKTVTTSNGAVIETVNNTLLTFTPEQCVLSDLYQGCYFRYMQLEDVNEDATILVQGDGSPAGAEEVRSLLVYFEDPECRNVAGWKGFVNGHENTIQALIASTSVNTCRQAMPCLLNPNGTECQTLTRTNAVVRSVLPVDDFLFRETISGQTRTVESSNCLSSVAYPGLCYYRWISVNVLSNEPAQTLVPAGTGATTLGPEPNSAAGISAALVSMLCGLLMALLAHQ